MQTYRTPSVRKMVKTANELNFNLSDGLPKAVQHGDYTRVKQLLKKAPRTFLARNDRNFLIPALRINNEISRDKIFKCLIEKGANIR